MQVINNIDTTLGDDLKKEISPKSSLSVTPSFFAIYAYEALKKELEEAGWPNDKKTVQPKSGIQP